MKIVFLDAATLGDVSLEPISALGELVCYRTSSREEAIARVAEAEVLIVNKVRVDKALVDAAPRLRLICEAATGVNNIDLGYAASKGIPVRNAVGYSTDSVVQTTFMMILALVGKCRYFDDFVRSGEYSRSGLFTDVSKMFFELKGKRLGIIGLGNIGSRVARVGEAFGMEVSYFSTSGTSHSREYPSISLDELMSAIETSNTDIRKSDQAILESHYDTLDAKGAYTPTIDLLLTGTYMANPSLGPIKVSPSDVKGLPDIMASVWTDPIDVSMKMDNNRVQGQLTLTQPIYTWGKISNAVKLYETVESLRTMERNDKLDQKETELRTRLDALYWMGEIYDLLDSIDETADRLISIAETGKENGMLLEEDVLDAKIQQRQSDVARRELDSQYSAVIEGLRTLTRIPDLSPDMIDYTPDTSLYDSILSMDPEEIKSMAVSPDSLPLRMLSGMGDVQEYRKNIAKGSIYGLPDIALQVSASYGGVIDSNWLDSDTWGVNITLALTTNLWDGGKKLNDIKRAESGIKSAELDYEAAVRTIEENSVSAYNEAMLSMEKIEYLEAKADLNDSKIAKEERRLELGTSSESDVLTMKLDSLQNESELLSERIKLSASVSTLMYLTSSGMNQPLITDGTV